MCGSGSGEEGRAVSDSGVPKATWEAGDPLPLPLGALCAFPAELPASRPVQAPQEDGGGGQGC